MAGAPLSCYYFVACVCVFGVLPSGKAFRSCRRQLVGLDDSLVQCPFERGSCETFVVDVKPPVGWPVGKGKARPLRKLRIVILVVCGLGKKKYIVEKLQSVAIITCAPVICV